MLPLTVQNSDGHLSRILQAVTDGIVVVNQTGTVVFANRSAAEILGRTELLGRHFGIALPDDSGRSDVNLVRAGGLGWAELRTARMVWDDADATLVSIRDVTERHESQTKLSLAAKVFESSHEGIVVTDAAGRIELVNHAFTQATGYAAGEVVGKNPRILKSGLQDGNFYKKMWADLLASGIWSGEIWNRRKDGTVYPELLTISSVLSGKGNPINYVGAFSDLSERKNIEGRLQHLSRFDALTGLHNRTTFHDRVQQQISMAMAHKAKLAYLIINIDHMRLVNDECGIAVGDRLLHDAAHRLLNAVSGRGMVSRLGADEFGALLVDVSDADDVMLIGKTLQERLGEPFEVDGHRIEITATLGVSLFPDDATTLSGLLGAADSALSTGKKYGKGQINLYKADLNERAQRALRIEGALRHAIERNELVLHYQPQVDAKSCCIVGVEALLRWNSRDLGPVGPDEFIPIAELNGLIVPIGAWVLEQACHTAAAWQQAGLPEIRMAINVSAYQLIHDDLPQRVMQCLAISGLDKKCIELEVTESVTVGDDQRARDSIKKLHSLGLRLALDDFGTGFSSLSYLIQMPIDLLKIDQSFVREVTSEPSSAAIARATISLAKSLGMGSIAEGVETEGQMNFLRESGCEMFQGYLFSRPVPAVEIEKILLEGRCFDRFALSIVDSDRSLLIIDDDPAILSSLHRLLRNRGYRVLTATSGSEGLELLATHNIQIVISDQLMAGMTGTDFLMRVKELHPNTVRMLLSGYTDLQSVINSVNAGSVFRFLTKPWDDDELKASIKQAFDMYDRLYRKVHRAT